MRWRRPRTAHHMGTVNDKSGGDIAPEPINHLHSQSEIGKEVLIFEQAKRISLMVTTDSVCDLPEALKKEFGICICPYYVRTEQGQNPADGLCQVAVESLFPVEHLIVTSCIGRQSYHRNVLAQSPWH